MGGTLAKSRAILLSGLVLALLEFPLQACSGPGAARHIRQSELIGTGAAIFAIAMVGLACRHARRQGLGPRIPWMVAPLALHPRLWMDAVHGDCGVSLVSWSLVMTPVIAGFEVFAVCWPNPTGANSTRGRWVFCGALLGVIIGLVFSVSFRDALSSEFKLSPWLAGGVVGGLTLAGALIASDLFDLRLQAAGGRRFSLRSRLRSLVCLPVLLIPTLVVLCPVLPYHWSTSTTSPFHFVVTEARTGRPIAGAAVRLLDPRFDPGDKENQGQRVVTGVDGAAEYYLHANVSGREGLLGRTETITYAPWLLHVEAPGFQPFLASLADAPSTAKDRLTDPALGMTFPPPASMTIHLRPNSISSDKDKTSSPGGTISN